MSLNVLRLVALLSISLWTCYCVVKEGKKRGSINRNTVVAVGHGLHADAWRDKLWVFYLYSMCGTEIASVKRTVYPSLPYVNNLSSLALAVTVVTLLNMVRYYNASYSFVWSFMVGDTFTLNVVRLFSNLPLSHKKVECVCAASNISSVKTCFIINCVFVKCDLQQMGKYSALRVSLIISETVQKFSGGCYCMWY